MSEPLPTVRIGLSGWHYPEWRGGFYPHGLRRGEELAFVSARFATLEINSTFYGPQPPERYASWAARTPDAFVFAVKGPRHATRGAELTDPAPILARFFASGVLELGGKLGPFLWQFPASVPFDPGIFAGFVAALPHEAGGRPLRHAIEVRHASFATSEWFALLREHGVALVAADSPAWPRLKEVTAGFVYCRLHGAERLYVSGYDESALKVWAERIAAWAAGGRDVYVYFDNTMQGRAPEDALALRRLLGARNGPPP